MNKIQNALLKKIAGVGKSAAVKAAGAASWGCCHQPKEPKALQNLIALNMYVQDLGLGRRKVTSLRNTYEYSLLI